jgi:hypothetical protein
MKLIRRLRLSCVAILCLVVMCYAFMFVVYEVRTMWRAGATNMMLHDVREVFVEFHRKNHRWPDTIQEVYGLETHEGIVMDDRSTHEVLSGEPFRCVTKEGLYYRIDTEEPDQIILMLSKPYRTKLWPFGKMETMIATPRGVRMITPGQFSK